MCSGVRELSDHWDKLMSLITGFEKSKWAADFKGDDTSTWPGHFSCAEKKTRAPVASGGGTWSRGCAPGSVEF